MHNKKQPAEENPLRAVVVFGGFASISEGITGHSLGVGCAGETVMVDGSVKKGVSEPNQN